MRKRIREKSRASKPAFGAGIVVPRRGGTMCRLPGAGGEGEGEAEAEAEAEAEGEAEGEALPFYDWTNVQGDALQREGFRFL